MKYSCLRTEPKNDHASTYKYQFTGNTGERTSSITHRKQSAKMIPVPQQYSKCGVGPAASPSTGKMLEKQILSSYPKLMSSDTLGAGTENYVLTRPGDFDAHSSLRTMALKKINDEKFKKKIGEGGLL